MQDKPPSIERRRFERRPLRHTVSFSPKDGRGSSSWYLGQVKDAGLAGMKISCRQTVKLAKGQKIMILCPMDGNMPVWIGAKVAWYDSESQCFGLSYL